MAALWRQQVMQEKMLLLFIDSQRRKVLEPIFFITNRVRIYPFGVGNDLEKTFRKRPPYYIETIVIL